MKTIEGNLSAAGQKIGIVAARFNEFITSKLLSGAEDSFIRHGGNGDDLETAWVPGSFEIPFIARKMALSGKYDAIVCLGAVIRGATPHFDMVGFHRAGCRESRYQGREQRLRRHDHSHRDGKSFQGVKITAATAASVSVRCLL